MPCTPNDGAIWLRPRDRRQNRSARALGKGERPEGLLPGDPRLPRTAGDGRAWPRAAGALVCTAQLNMATKAGREAFEVIRFFGPAESAFSIGYKVAPNGATHRGGIRYLTNLDLFEISAVLHGANRYSTLLSVKSAPPLETKSTSGVVAAQRRAGMPTATPCSVCGRPAAAVVPGGLRAGETLICVRCVDQVADDDTDTDTDTAVLDADDIAAAYRLTDTELTSEEEYEQALGADVEWEMLADGTLARTADRARRGGRAWGRP